MKYEDVSSWRMPEPEHFSIIAGILSGALKDFAAYVAKHDPDTTQEEITKWLNDWGRSRKLPIDEADDRFWKDIIDTPREYPPFTPRANHIQRLPDEPEAT